MRTIRVILALVLLTAGPVRSTDAAAAAQTLRLTGEISAAARCELARLIDDSAGAIRLTASGDTSVVRLSRSAEFTARFAKWARDHGLSVPIEAPDQQLLISAAEAVATDPDTSRPGGNLISTPPAMCSSPVADGAGRPTGLPHPLVRLQDASAYPSGPRAPPFG